MAEYESESGQRVTYTFGELTAHFSPEQCDAITNYVDAITAHNAFMHYVALTAIINGDE